VKGKLYGVILSGGIGSRFWPLSRETTPKQLLRVVGEESLLKRTIARITPLIPHERVSIVTNPAQAETIRLHLGYGKKLAGPGYVIEPVGRNTAPAIGLAAVELLKKDPGAEGLSKGLKGGLAGRRRRPPRNLRHTSHKTRDRLRLHKGRAGCKGFS
jgi:mannose-1-phosphate guanylyltransferase